MGTEDKKRESNASTNWETGKSEGKKSESVTELVKCLPTHGNISGIRIQQTCACLCVLGLPGGGGGVPRRKAVSPALLGAAQDQHY